MQQNRGTLRKWPFVLVFFAVLAAGYVITKPASKPIPHVKHRLVLAVQPPAPKAPSSWSQNYGLTILYAGQTVTVQNVTATNLNSKNCVVTYTFSVIPGPGGTAWLRDKQRYSLVVAGSYYTNAKVARVQAQGPRQIVTVTFTRWPTALTSHSALELQIPNGSGAPQVVKLALEIPSDHSGLQELAGGNGGL
jgi:hypothetical protein